MKRVGVVCLLLALLTTAACGGDGDSDGKKPSSDSESSSSLGTKQPTTANVVVTETGYANNSVYAFLENRESREVPINPVFTGYDAANNRVNFPGTSTIYLMQPGGKTFVSTAAFKDTITRVEVQPRVAADAKLPKHGSGGFEASVAKPNGSTLGKLQVTVKSSYQQNVSEGELTVPCRNSSGKVITASKGDFDVPKGGTVETQVSVLNDSSDGLYQCEAYANIVVGTTFSD